MKNYLNIIIVQYCPVFLNIEESYNKIDKLISEKYSNITDIDVIVLPELALTGYIFPDKESLDKLSDTEQDNLQNYNKLKLLSQKYNCYLIAGFPEKIITNNNAIYYNSSYIINREGNIIKKYRKNYLYDADKPYFNSGKEINDDKFLTLTSNFDILNNSIKLGLGICMDMNSRNDESFFKFSFGTYCNNNKCDLVILLSNWLESKDDSSQIEDYLVYRLGSYVTDNIKKKKYFIFANRTGIEGDTKFCGNSLLINLETPSLLKLSKTEEKSELLKLYFN